MAARHLRHTQRLCSRAESRSGKLPVPIDEADLVFQRGKALIEAAWLPSDVGPVWRDACRQVIGMIPMKSPLVVLDVQDVPLTPDMQRPCRCSAIVSGLCRKTGFVLNS